MFSTVWNKVKSWAGWNDAGTIVKARLEAAAGVMAAAASGLIAFDWMPYVTSGKVDWKSVGAVAAYLLVSGVLTEVIRRKNSDL